MEPRFVKQRLAVASLGEHRALLSSDAALAEVAQLPTGLRASISQASLESC